MKYNPNSPAIWIALSIVAILASSYVLQLRLADRGEKSIPAFVAGEVAGAVSAPPRKLGE